MSENSPTDSPEVPTALVPEALGASEAPADTGLDGNGSADTGLDGNGSDGPRSANSGRGRSRSEAADEPENPLETEAEVAADYLEELLDITDLDGDIDTYVQGDRAHVSIVSDSTVLVGSDGEVLDALQELARLAVLTETGSRSRLMLDVAGYRDKRRKQLADLAKDAVEEARSSGEPVRLSAMNPFERKIVHDVVAAAGLTSESEGEEPQRRVVVLPAGA